MNPISLRYVAIASFTLPSVKLRWVMPKKPFVHRICPCSLCRHRQDFGGPLSLSDSLPVLSMQRTRSHKNPVIIQSFQPIPIVSQSRVSPANLIVYNVLKSFHE